MLTRAQKSWVTMRKNGTDREAINACARPEVRAVAWNTRRILKPFEYVVGNRMYKFIADAARYHNTSKTNICNRLDSDDYPECFRLYDPIPDLDQQEYREGKKYE